MIKKNIFPISLIGVGLIMMVYGIIQGQSFDVLQKAIRVCLECVGIG